MFELFFHTAKQILLDILLLLPDNSSGQPGVGHPSGLVVNFKH